jgi:PAS domain S-box-containing protein
LFFDRDGVVIGANDAFLAMTGYTREQVERRELDWRKMTPPEYVGTSEEELKKLSTTGQLGPYEKEYFLASGSRCWMMFAAQDLGDGTIVEYVIDITDRRRAEAALRESEERFRDFGEASSDILWMRDAETLDWVYLSQAFERIYGVSRDQALKGDTLRNWTELVDEEDRELALSNIYKVQQGERATFEYRIRRPSDGEQRWLRNTDFPIRDSSGKVVRIGGVGTDITDLKAAQEHQQVLLAELQHRVRNTLAVVRAIARRTAENSESAEDMLAHFQGRLDAFSRVQAAVTRHPDGLVDLHSLVEDELIAHAARDGRQVSIGGAELRIESKTAERLSLAIHELATNAVKHGALTNGAGKVKVAWARRERKGAGEELVLTWEESGLRLAHRELKREGFGMELLRRSLPYDLNAETEIELRPQGLRFELRMPLTGARRS